MGQRVLFGLVELVHVEDATHCYDLKDAGEGKITPVVGFHIDDDAGYNVREQAEPERRTIAIQRSEKR